MPDDEKVFSDEYESKNLTKGGTYGQEAETHLGPEIIEIDHEKYGINKPHRIIIRARLIRD